eukprot:621225-Prorocentrum_minimum.AAC.1
MRARNLAGYPFRKRIQPPGAHKKPPRATRAAARDFYWGISREIGPIFAVQTPPPVHPIDFLGA